MNSISSSGAVIALDIGGTFVKSGVVGAGGVLLTPIGTTPIESDGPATSILATLRQIIETCCHQMAGAPLLGIAAGVPGPFDYDRGIPLLRHKYAAIYGHDLQAALRSYVPGWHGPVRFRNDAEAAVMGEACYGAGRDFRRIIGLTLGTGLGSSFVVDRAPVYTGAGVPPNGEVWSLPFANTIADDIFSIRGLSERLRQANGADVTIIAAAEQARAGDARLSACFAEFGADLGAFILPYARDFGADAILLLGGIAGAADLFAAAMRHGTSTTIVAGELGAGAGLIGAATLIIPPAPVPRRD